MHALSVERRLRDSRGALTRAPASHTTFACAAFLAFSGLSSKHPSTRAFSSRVNNLDCLRLRFRNSSARTGEARPGHSVTIMMEQPLIAVDSFTVAARGSGFDDMALRYGLEEEEASVARRMICCRRHGCRFSTDEEERGRQLGTFLLKACLVAPATFGYWVLYAVSQHSTLEVVDSEGGRHALPLFHATCMMRFGYLQLSVEAAGLFAHNWLTLGEIAQQHRLDQPGKKYCDRIADAQTQAKTLTWWEWIHIFVIVAYGALNNYWYSAGLAKNTDWLSPQMFGVLGAAWTIIPLALMIYGFVKAGEDGARSNIIAFQRTDTAEFAGTALRGSLLLMLAQAILAGRYIAITMNYPASVTWFDCGFDQHSGWQSAGLSANLDPDTNSTWWAAAPIRTCGPDVFTSPINPKSKAKVYGWNGLETYQYQGTFNICVFLSCFGLIFFAARGQGLLPDRIWTDYIIEPAQVGFVGGAMVASFGALTALCAMWAGMGNRGGPERFRWWTFMSFGSIFVGTLVSIAFLWGRQMFIGVCVWGSRKTSRGKLTQKALVVSCPAKSTLLLEREEERRKSTGLHGDQVYNVDVMDHICEMADASGGKLKVAFDRPGSTNVAGRPGSWSRAAELVAFKQFNDVFKDPEAKGSAPGRREYEKMLKSRWYHGYRQAVKNSIITEMQGFFGEIHLICIAGGPITNFERDQMKTIESDAKKDGKLLRIRQCSTKIVEMRFEEFLAEYQYEDMSDESGGTLTRNLSTPDPVPADLRLLVNPYVLRKYGEDMVRQLYLPTTELQFTTSSEQYLLQPEPEPEPEPQ